MRAQLIVGFAILTASSPAFAGWQFTNWGMTPAQVVVASKGTAQLGNGEPGDRMKDSPHVVGAVGTYSSGTHHFRATYYFDGGKLSLVMLKLTNGTNGCGMLWADMKSAYGKPFSEKGGLINDAIWHDVAKNNFVAVLEIGELCNLSYKPLKSANTSGL
jgi:hypothetical protein